MNIFDIARMAGVSRKTVQRVLNNTESVKPETREKIRRIMEQHHYEPNETARRLTTKRTRTIGIFIIQNRAHYELHSDDLYFGAVIGGIINQCTAMNYRALLMTYDISMYEPLLSVYKQKSIDAGIIVSWSDVQEIVDRVTGAGFYIGIFDQNNVANPPEGTPIPHLDNRKSAYLATQYLLGLGHKRLGIVTGDMAIRCSRERLDGFLSACREQSIPVSDSQIYYGNFIEDSGSSACEYWIREQMLPTAIFCSNDLMAYGALKTLVSAGVSVPEQVSVIGFDDLLISKYMYPPLSTMSVPRVDMAEKLTRHIIQTLENGEDTAFGSDIFEASLTIRSSCDVPAATVSTFD
jgi:LacI family transcriptional regulator